MINPEMSLRSTYDASTQTCSLYLYDFIGAGGITARDVLDQLQEHRAAKAIAVFINSPGGSAWDGFAIYSLLRRHTAKVHVHIDGVAASIASAIAMAGDTITMSRNAHLMIHNPSGGRWGEAKELRAYASMLDMLQRSIVSLYASRSSLSVADLVAKCEAETWFSAADALACGFADEVAEQESDAKNLAHVHADNLAAFSNVPDSLLDGRSSNATLSHDRFMESRSLQSLAEMTGIQSAANTMKQESCAVPQQDQNGVAAPGAAANTITLSVADYDAKVKAASESAVRLASLDAETDKTAAVSKARKDAVVECKDVIARCGAAGLTLEASLEMVGQPLVVVQDAIISQLASRNAPVGTGNGDRQAADPDAAYKAEYKSGGGEAVLGITEEVYVASRRCDANGGVIA